MDAHSIEFIQVVTTFADQQEARRIASDLVTSRLAACVQIEGPIESHYRWNDAVQCDTEWRISIKTSTTKFSDVESYLLQNHSYDQPEIIALPIIDGNAGYQQWLRDQVRG